jgi:hypothetical protein
MNLIIGFSHPRKFSLHGWIIEKVDGVPYDHAYLRFNLDKVQRNIVFQSIAVGVQLVSESEFEGLCTPLEEYQLYITEAQFISMFQFCIDKAGKPYGLLDVIGLGIAKILNKIGIRKSNPFYEGDANYFCSQIIAQCLDNIDPSQFNINADNTSPSDLNSLLKQLNIKRIL